MKKYILLLFVFIVSFFTVVYAGSIDLEYDGEVHIYNGPDVTLILKDEKFVLTEGLMPPVIIDDRTLVPVREVFEKLGGGVSWNQDDKSATVTLGGKKIIVWIDNNVASVDGEDVELDVPAKLINSKTMVPLRFISEKSGLLVEWDGETHTVTVSEEKKIVAPEDEENKNDDIIDGIIKIEAVKVKDIEDITNVIIYLSGDTAYNCFSLKEPNRVVIDISNSEFDFDREPIDILENNLTKVRFGIQDGDVNRIVLDVKTLEEYSVEYDDEEKAVYIKLGVANKEEEKKVPTAKILIDIGHGGKDPGAVNGTAYEKVYDMAIAKKLYKLLKDTEGITVEMDRKKDIYLTREERVEIANESDADLLVSIHNNSLSDKSVKGTMVLYYNGELDADNGITSKEFAKYVLDELVEELETENRGLQKREDMHILSKTVMPAILCEVVFMSNDDELKRLQDDDFQTQAAEAIYRGIMKAVVQINEE